MEPGRHINTTEGRRKALNFIASPTMEHGGNFILPLHSPLRAKTQDKAGCLTPWKMWYVCVCV